MMNVRSVQKRCLRSEHTNNMSTTDTLVFGNIGKKHALKEQPVIGHVLSQLYLIISSSNFVCIVDFTDFKKNIISYFEHLLDKSVKDAAVDELLDCTQADNAVERIQYRK